MRNPLDDLEPKKLYFIRDTRVTVGNSAMWWRPDRAGYTCSIDEAGRYEEQEALSIVRIRGTDVPYPCEVIEPLTRRHVDVQDLRKVEKLQLKKGSQRTPDDNCPKEVSNQRGPGGLDE
jgi:hypothetical protein